MKIRGLVRLRDSDLERIPAVKSVILLQLGLRVVRIVEGLTVRSVIGILIATSRPSC